VPEGVAGADGAPAFAWPEEIPWSELGEEFIGTWGHDERGRLRAEHMEVMGQSGGGKSYAIATIFQQRAQRWGTAEIVALSKNTDDSIPLLGWPQASTWEEAKRYRWVTFWPQTALKGEEREAYHEQRFYGLLSSLWPDPGQQANVVLYLDECRYLEGLSQRLRKLVRMYWREGRSHGVSLIAGAQRPLEMVRDQHSESRWKLVFAPADEGDMQRFAEMLGPWRDWAPVLRGLDQTRHQFVLRNTFTKDTYITWIDRELRPLPSQADQQPRNTAPYGKQQHPAS
jgi:hypothetical protein